MTWPIIIAQLIVQFGLPAARDIIEIIKKVKSPDDLTDADWQKLKDLVATPYSTFVPVPGLPTATG